MFDFTTIFAKTKIERLHFRTQWSVNYQHNIVFLSSYLHDATFKVADISFSKGTLSIPIERDCWEFWTRIHQVRNELLGCKSLLTISGVKSLKWSKKRLPKEVELTSVFIGERHFLSDYTQLVLYSEAQKLRLDILGNDSFFEIELNDLEDPT